MQVRIYEIGPQGQSQGKAMYSHEGPVLDLCWSADGSRLFSCGADKAARMFDLSTNGNNGQAVQIGAHDAPIKCVRWIESPGGGILATGSWDKSIRVRANRRLGHFQNAYSAAVLGLEESESCCQCADSRPCLLYGRPVSTFGCRDGRETYSNH